MNQISHSVEKETFQTADKNCFHCIKINHMLCISCYAEQKRPKDFYNDKSLVSFLGFCSTQTLFFAFIFLIKSLSIAAVLVAFSLLACFKIAFNSFVSASCTLVRRLISASVRCIIPSRPLVLCGLALWLREVLTLGLSGRPLLGRGLAASSAKRVAAITATIITAVIAIRFFFIISPK